MQDLKKAFAAAALATAVLTAAGGANATQYTNAPTLAPDGSLSWTFGDDGGIVALPDGTFEEIFEFTVPSKGVWSGTLANSFTSSDNELTFGPAATINGIAYTTVLPFFERFTMLPAVAGGAEIKVFGSNPGPAAQFVGTLNFTPTAAPEPAAWALMILGFAGMATAMRAHRRRTPGATFLLA